MPYTLRRMEPGDIPVVAAIDRVSFPTPWPAAAFRREIKRRRAFYYVLLRPRERPGDSDQGWAERLRDLFSPKERSRVVGYVGFRLQGDEGHITTIALHPDWRGRGLGRLLLLVALERMLDHGMTSATLEMRPSNDLAYRLYTSHGFEVERRRRGYYQDGEDAWIMTAEIDSDDYRRRLDRWREELKERLRGEQIEVRQNGRAYL